MAAKSIMDMLSWQKANGPALKAPPVAPPALLLDDSHDTPAGPLQALADEIERSTADLLQLHDIRGRLDSLRGVIASEFDNRLVDAGRIGQLTAELKTALAKLADTEGSLQRANERGRDLEQQVIRLGADLEQSNVALAATTESLERLKPDHQSALAEIEDLRAQAASNGSEIFDLKTDRDSLARQLELLETARSNGEALLARTREVSAEMESRAEAALKRLEQASAENIALERVISEMKVVVAGEQERAGELASQLAAARAETRQAKESMKEASEVSRAEIKDLRAKLEEALSKSNRIQQLHHELSSGQQALMDDKSKLQRDLAAVQAETRQMSQRLEVQDSWLADWRRRFGDVDAARLVAVDRAEHLQVSLTQSDAAAKRSEALAAQKDKELVEAHRAHEAEQARLKAESADARSQLSQVKAELKMIRGALDAKKARD